MGNNRSKKLLDEESIEDTATSTQVRQDELAAEERRAGNSIYLTHLNYNNNMIRELQKWLKFKQQSLKHVNEQRSKT